LAEGERWTKRIQSAYSTLEQKLRLSHERHLANLFTHRGMAPHPFAGQQITAGRVAMAIPDAPRKRVRHASALTSSEKRELRTFSHQALDAVDAFVIEMLAALRDGEEEILRRREA
jgi:hypothetical protein